MVFSTLENIFYPKNIHLCASVFSIFFIRLSTSARVDYNCISTFENIFNLKNVHLCASWLNGIFYTEKYFLPEEYTPLWECFAIFFHWRFPLSKSTKLVFHTFETVFYPKNIYVLCDMTKMFVSTLRNVFYPKNIHLCASISNFLLKNIYLCASWLKWYFFTWKFYLHEEYTPLCECWKSILWKNFYLRRVDKNSFSTLENII